MSTTTLNFLNSLWEFTASLAVRCNSSSRPTQLVRRREILTTKRKIPPYQSMKLLVEIHAPTTGIDMNQYPIAVLRGAVRFYFSPICYTIPRRGAFCVRMPFGFCFNHTVQAIPWGWGARSSLHSHSVIGRPQRSCAFFLRSNPKAGEIPDLLHYSPNLTICSNRLPPYHHEAGRLSAHHVYRWLCRSWWNKQCIKTKTIHWQRWRGDIFQEAENWQKWRGHHRTRIGRTHGGRGGRGEVGVEECIQRGGNDSDKSKNMFPLQWPRLWFVPAPDGIFISILTC